MVLKAIWDGRSQAWHQAREGGGVRDDDGVLEEDKVEVDLESNGSCRSGSSSCGVALLVVALIPVGSSRRCAGAGGARCSAEFGTIGRDIA